MTRDPTRCSTRPAATSSAAAASGSARWRWPRCSARAGRRPRPPAARRRRTRWRRGRATSRRGRRASSTCSWPAGPSQLELFDYKPELQEYTTSRSPSRSSRARGSPSWTRSPRSRPKLLGTTRKFAQHGESGPWVSECLPHIAGVVDDLAFVRSVATDVVQPRAGEAVRQHRLDAVRPAEHGVVGHLRDRQRVATTCPASSSSSPARAARAAGRSTGGAGSCRRPTRASRSASGGEPILNLATPAGDLARPPAAGDRRDPRPEPDAARRHRRPRDRHPDRLLRDGLPDADERPGADRPGGRDRRRRSTSTAPSRASRRSPTTACWPAGWSSAASGSSSSTTPTGTTTAAPARP